ncbi:hypothetical protein ACERZ8_10130 [Tateyamaria armeniaca]|uniref:Uncharacterized protein n=1 Tax=Tateyamaria armeniaca TaxID=2518930 RepID=A0ABW8USW5_9RHOB
MTKRFSALALALLVTAPSLATAQSITIRQNFVLPVAPIDADSFEVVEADGAGNSQMWCAAGIYARKVLGVQRGDIYVETPRGPSQTMPGRKGVVFTTSPVDGAFSTVSLSTRRAGLTRSVGHANAVCSQFRDLRIRTGPNTLLRR